MYKVLHNGVEIQCDSADEAIEIATRLGGSPGNGARKSASSAEQIGNSRWTAARFQSFCSQIQDKPRLFLRQLLNNPDGVTDEVMRQSMNVANNKGFGPIITGMSRKAKKLGIGLQEILTSEKIALQSGEKILEFKIAPSFRKVAEENGGIK